MTTTSTPPAGVSAAVPGSPASGWLLGLGAFLIWGFFPIYFKAVEEVPPLEILAHRVIWSFVLLALIISFQGGWDRVRRTMASGHTVLMLFSTSVIIALSWLTFIWAVNNGHILDTSLGYYINPLISVLFGMIFFGERLTRLQWIAMALATAGVLLQLIQIGTLPLIALVLAVTFALYGMLRKKVAVDSLIGLLVETGLLLPAALGMLFFADTPTSSLANNSLSLNLLLMAGGVVTTVPLLCFTAAANRLPLSAVGFLQYIAPSTAFLLAIFCYNEPFSPTRGITFLFIWVALVFFSIDALRRMGKKLN
jgi:chloramphenicol-sensitive protein RarD